MARSRVLNWCRTCAKGRGRYRATWEQFRGDGHAGSIRYEGNALDTQSAATHTRPAERGRISQGDAQTYQPLSSGMAICVEPQALSDSFVAAIDQGTSSSRCLVFDQQGRIVSLSQKEHEQIFPRPGWVEHDP